MCKVGGGGFTQILIEGLRLYFLRSVIKNYRQLFQIPKNNLFSKGIIDSVFQLIYNRFEFDPFKNGGPGRQVYKSVNNFGNFFPFSTINLAQQRKQSTKKTHSQKNQSISFCVIAAFNVQFFNAFFICYIPCPPKSWYVSADVILLTRNFYQWIVKNDLFDTLPIEILIWRITSLRSLAVE